MPQPGDPRTGAVYRRNCALTLTTSDRCHLCGHPGAMTVDHIVSVKRWRALYGTLQGVNDLSNLAPAHGTRGRVLNACPTCGLVCNQSKGAGAPLPSPRSREW